MIGLTVPFDPAAEARPLESEQSQAAVQKSQKKSCYDSWAELLGAIDRASHHRCEDHGENEIEGRLFREKAFVRKSDNDERGEENQHGAERDLQDSQAGSFHTDTECRKKVVHYSNESPTPEGMSVPESFMSRRSGTKTRQPGLRNAPIMRQDHRPQREMRPIRGSLRRRKANCAALLFPFCVRRSLVLCAHPLRRLADDFPRARNVELFLNIGPVSFDGFFTQMQLARNLVHVVSFAD